MILEFYARKFKRRVVAEGNTRGLTRLAAPYGGTDLAAVTLRSPFDHHSIASLTGLPFREGGWATVFGSIQARLVTSADLGQKLRGVAFCKCGQSAGLARRVHADPRAHPLTRDGWHGAHAGRTGRGLVLPR